MSRQNIVQSKVSEFLNPKLEGLQAGLDGSVADKVWAIYSLFKSDIDISNRHNKSNINAIHRKLNDPTELFHKEERNSLITTLDVQFEFRRQLLTYLEGLMPQELKAAKEANFQNARDKITELDKAATQINLKARVGSSAGTFALGVVLMTPYISNCVAEGGITSLGAVWGGFGAFFFLMGMGLGSHTVYVGCRQRKVLKSFENVDESEHSALFKRGNIQINPLDADLFSQDKLMWIATSRISEASSNEDVTYKGQRLI